MVVKEHGKVSRRLADADTTQRKLLNLLGIPPGRLRTFKRRCGTWVSRPAGLVGEQQGVPGPSDRPRDHRATPWSGGLHKGEPRRTVARLRTACCPTADSCPRPPRWVLLRSRRIRASRAPQRPAAGLGHGITLSSERVMRKADPCAWQSCRRPCSGVPRGRAASERKANPSIPRRYPMRAPR